MENYESLIHEFILTYTRPETRKKYRLAITRFLDHYGKDPETAQAIDLLEYIDAQPWRATTAHINVTAIRLFYAYTYGKRHPINSVKVPRGNARRGRSLSWYQVERLLEIHNPDTAMGARNRAIIRLMVDTGLRAHEVCHVQFADIDWGKNRLQVNGKGDTWEYVVFSITTAGELRNWGKYRRDISKCTNLFCSLSLAYKYRGQPLTKEGLQGCFKKWTKDLGFRVSPHDLRRTMAVLMCEQGAPTRVIQLQGRWKTLDLVERYTQNLRLDTAKSYLPNDKFKQKEDI